MASPSLTPTEGELEDETEPVATGAAEMVAPPATAPRRARPGEGPSGAPPATPRTEGATPSDAERELAAGSPVHAEDLSSPQEPQEPPEAVTVGAEDLFEHLLQHQERISYGTAYRALLGASGRPWRGVIDVPLVLRAARGTATRSVEDVQIGLDALIVNKKTKRLTSGHFRERPYAEDVWLAHFATWPLCGHSVEQLHVAGAESAGGSLPEAPDAAVRVEASAPGGAAATEIPAAARVTESAHREAAATEPAPVVSTAASIVPHHFVGRPVAEPSSARRLAAPIGAIVFVLLVSAGSLVASRVVSSPNAASEPQVAGTVAGRQDVRDRFDSLPIGADPGWQTTGARQDPGFLGVAPWPTSIDRSVRLKTAPDGRPLSACRTISAVRSGVLVAEMRMFLDGYGNADAPIASIRAGGDQVAALRVGQRGEIAGGATGSPTSAAMSLAAWYDVAFTVDVANRNYRLTVAASNSPTSIYDQTAGWASQAGSGIDGICFTSPGGTEGHSLYINELHLASR